MSEQRRGHATVRLSSQGAARHVRAQRRLSRGERAVAAAAAVAISTFAFAGRVRAQDAAPAPSVPVIVTTGDAVVRRAPDVAFVSVAVESRSRSSRDAQQMNAQALAAVQRRLADARVPREALRSLGLSLEPEFEMTNGRRTPRGFVARTAFEVRVDDVDRLGEIADAVVDAGATSLSGIRYDLRDRTAAEREALKQAVEDARGRAEAAAAGAGRSVDRVLRIEDSRAEIAAPRPIAFARADVAPATEPAPGVVEIRGHVSLTVSIK